MSTLGCALFPSPLLAPYNRQTQDRHVKLAPLLHLAEQFLPDVRRIYWSLSRSQETVSVELFVTRPVLTFRKEKVHMLKSKLTFSGTAALLTSSASGGDFSFPAVVRFLFFPLN